MKTVLLIDDDESIRVLLRHHLRKSGYTVLTAGSGEEGLSLSKTQNPDLILLDINMPKSKFSGLDILPLIKTDRNIASIPVIMITSRKDLDTIRKAVLLQANGYITKPFKKEYVLNCIGNFINKKVEEHWKLLDSSVRDFLAETLTFYNALENNFSDFKGPDILAKAGGVADTIFSASDKTLFSILETLTNHNSELFTHSTKVGIYLSFFAKAVNEERGIFTTPEIKEIILGGLLHDLGIIKISESIIIKRARGEISPSELKEWRSHVEVGVGILREIPSVPPVVIDIAEKHHEVWDGSGFPNRLCGGGIGVPALMIAIVDFFEYAVAPRIKKGKDEMAGLRELMNHKDKFDEVLFGIFQKMIRDHF